MEKSFPVAPAQGTTQWARQWKFNKRAYLQPSDYMYLHVRALCIKSLCCILCIPKILTTWGMNKTWNHFVIINTRVLFLLIHYALRSIILYLFNFQIISYVHHVLCIIVIFVICANKSKLPLNPSWLSEGKSGLLEQSAPCYSIKIN